MLRRSKCGATGLEGSGPSASTSPKAILRESRALGMGPGPLFVLVLVAAALGSTACMPIETTSSPTIEPAETTIPLRTRVVYIETTTLALSRLLTSPPGLPDYVPARMTISQVGLGFYIGASAFVGTAAHVVQVQVARLRMRLANDVLARWGYTFSDPYRHYRVPVQVRNRWLQLCYRGVVCKMRTSTAVSIRTLTGSRLSRYTSVLDVVVPNPSVDVAILEVGESPPGPALEIRDPPSEGAGWVVLLPGDLDGSTSQASEVIVPLLFERRGTRLHLKAGGPLPSGSSGAPVMDTSGHVIGVISRRAEGAGPNEAVATLASQLCTDGRLQPCLGQEDDSPCSRGLGASRLSQRKAAKRGRADTRSR